MAKSGVSGGNPAGFHTPFGAGAPGYSNGTKTQHMPKRLREEFEKVMQDPDLLSLSKDVGVLEVRLRELEKRLYSGEAGVLWDRLVVLITTFKSAMAQGDGDKIKESLGQIESTIMDGAEERIAWQELRALQRDKADLVTKERQWHKDMQMLITVERAMILFTQMSECVMRHVSSDTIRKKIAEDLRKLVGTTDDPSLPHPIDALVHVPMAGASEPLGEDLA